MVCVRQTACGVVACHRDIAPREASSPGRDDAPIATSPRCAAADIIVAMTAISVGGRFGVSDMVDPTL